MISVLIVDDQALVRGGFAMILDARDDIEVVGEATDGAEAVSLALEHEPDVILMDVRMPNVDGIDATRRITEAGLDSHIVILTTFDLDELVFAALRAGASGFLLKDIRPEELAQAVRLASSGEALLAPTVTRRLIDRFVAMTPETAANANLDDLTTREREVLALVANGMSNTEIAGFLQLTNATIKAHVSAILRKCGLRDRVQAVIFAYDCGLVAPNSSA